MTYPDKEKIFFKGDWIKKLERKCNLLSCVEWKSWLLQNETLHDIIVAPNIPEKIIEFLPLELHSCFFPKYWTLAESNHEGWTVLINVRPDFSKVLSSCI